MVGGMCRGIPKIMFSFTGCLGKATIASQIRPSFGVLTGVLTPGLLTCPSSIRDLHLLLCARPTWSARSKEESTKWE